MIGRRRRGLPGRRRLVLAAVLVPVVVLAIAWTTGLIGGAALPGPPFPVAATSIGDPPPPDGRFAVGPALRLRLRGGSGPLYLFQTELSTPELARRVAGVLAVDGDLHEETDLDVRWQVRDDAGAAVTVHDWPSRLLEYTAGRDDVRLCPGDLVPATGGGCAGGEPLERYDDAAAARDAQGFVDRLVPGHGTGAGDALDWRPGPSGDGRTAVLGRLPATGADGPVLWTVTFTRTGRVLTASGPLAPLRNLGDYPTASVSAAAGRVGAPWLPVARPQLWVPISCARGPAVRLSAYLEPKPATSPGAGQPNPVFNPPAPVVETLERTEDRFAVVNDRTCAQYVAPVIRFIGEFGSTVDVLALADEALATAPSTPDPVVTSVPAPPPPGYSSLPASIAPEPH